jgi:ATP-dependent Lon protease
MDSQKRIITLDDLAIEKLPAGLIAAIGHTTVEELKWRKDAMNGTPQQATAAPIRPAHERTLPVVVLGEVVILPGMPVPLQISSQGRSYRALESVLAIEGAGPQADASDAAARARREHFLREQLQAIRRELGEEPFEGTPDAPVQRYGEVLLVFVAEADIERFKTDEPQPLPPVGVVAQIHDFLRLPEGWIRIVFEGVARAAITGRVQSDPFYLATCLPHPDPEIETPEAHTLMGEVKAQVGVIVGAMPGVSREAVAFVNRITQPGRLADVLSYGPQFGFEQRLEILRTLDPIQRLRHMRRELSQLSVP